MAFKFIEQNFKVHPLFELGDIPLVLFIAPVVGLPVIVGIRISNIKSKGPAVISAGSTTSYAQSPIREKSRVFSATLEEKTLVE